MNYPGDTADPKDVARWMATVAEEEYSLPGVLPVMTSCVELTQAWTGPGDVKDVPGYLEAQDHDSLGYFQQRPSTGWGTPAQITDANYALRAFCAQARRIEDDSPADTPQQLGAWCQAVQRSAFPDRYADLGYPMAIDLLSQTEGGGNGGTNGGTSSYGWFGYESATSWNLKYHGPDVKEDGGLWQKYGYYIYASATSWNLVYIEGTGSSGGGSGTGDCTWPEANDTPDSSSWYYAVRNPTRYSWPGNRDDVNTLACWLVNNYNVSVNTYHHHPEEVWLRDGVSREYDSLDVWGPDGRGDPLDYDTGQEIFGVLFNDPNPPNIDWIIWQAVMYGAWNGWNGEGFGTDDFSWHYDHIHITYRDD